MLHGRLTKVRIEVTWDWSYTRNNLRPTYKTLNWKEWVDCQVWTKWVFRNNNINSLAKHDKYKAGNDIYCMTRSVKNTSHPLTNPAKPENDSINSETQGHRIQNHSNNERQRKRWNPHNNWIKRPPQRVAYKDEHYWLTLLLLMVILLTIPMKTPCKEPLEAV